MNYCKVGNLKVLLLLVCALILFASIQLVWLTPVAACGWPPDTSVTSPSVEGLGTSIDKVPAGAQVTVAGACFAPGGGDIVVTWQVSGGAQNKIPVPVDTWTLDSDGYGSWSVTFIVPSDTPPNTPLTIGILQYSGGESPSSQPQYTYNLVVSGPAAAQSQQQQPPSITQTTSSTSPLWIIWIILGVFVAVGAAVALGFILAALGIIDLGAIGASGAMAYTGTTLVASADGALWTTQTWAVPWIISPLLMAAVNGASIVGSELVHALHLLHMAGVVEKGIRAWDAALDGLPSAVAHANEGAPHVQWTTADRGSILDK